MFKLRLPAETGEPDEDLRDIRPFYYILIITIIVIYAWMLYEKPSLRQPLPFLLFTGLMLAYGLLHWFSPRILVSPRTVIIYILLQSGLIFLLTAISGSELVVMGLALALIGQMAGIIVDWWLSVLLAIGILLLAAIPLYFTSGWQTVSGLLATAVPLLFFIIIFVNLIARQMDARSEAQRLLHELEITHAQLGEYARQVENLTLENERQRIARELHDTLAQGLVGVILQLEAAEVHLEKGDGERAAAITEQAKSRARATLADARQAIADLRDRPPELLQTALSAEVERFTAATGIPCRLEVEADYQPEAQIQEQIERCVGEGLANIARHAAATQAWVVVGPENGGVTVAVGDDGRGFVLNETAVPAGHYGLIGLRERARLAGGHLEIRSEPGRGTELRMLLPD